MGLVPIGALGMVAACACGGLAHRAAFPAWSPASSASAFSPAFISCRCSRCCSTGLPGESKGDAVATSNFVNVTGAILATILFRVLVAVFQMMGLATEIPLHEYLSGPLTAVTFANGRPATATVDGQTLPPRGEAAAIKLSGKVPTNIEPDDPPDVVVETYAKHRHHYLIRLPGEKPERVYDRSHLPSYLFLGAGLTALLTLGLLWWQMPDLFARAAWVLRRAA